MVATRPDTPARAPQSTQTGRPEARRVAPAGWAAREWRSAAAVVAMGSMVEVIAAPWDGADSMRPTIRSGRARRNRAAQRTGGVATTTPIHMQPPFIEGPVPGSDGTRPQRPL